MSAMSSTVEINGKKMFLTKDVATQTSYSRDYVTRLARENKIEAVHVGRSWFVDPVSLERYSKASKVEKELRKQKLRKERKKEKEIHDAIKKQKASGEKRVKTINIQAAATAVLTLVLGVSGGLVFFDSGLTDIDVLKINAASVSSVSSVSAREETEHVFCSSSETRSLGEAEVGVLLMPDGELDSVTDLFSDIVEVVVNDDGTKSVVKVGEDGKVVGNNIPFVEVPMIKQTTL